MERALFIAKVENLKYVTSHFSRLYFGNEFCERLVPTPQDIAQVMDFVRERSLSFSLVTPYVTDEGLRKWEKVIRAVAEENPQSEVVINDWGVFRVTQNISKDLVPVLGRLMTKIKRGPRIANVLDKLPPPALTHLRSTNLSIDTYRTFLVKRGITRAELDYPLQDIIVDKSGSDLHLSLYIPFVYVTTTRFCLVASCDIPEQKGVVGIFPCRKECQKYTFALDNPVMGCTLIRKGNTIFYKNEKIPQTDELKGKKIDRVVIQPEIPL